MKLRFVLSPVERTAPAHHKPCPDGGGGAVSAQHFLSDGDPRRRSSPAFCDFVYASHLYLLYAERVGLCIGWHAHVFSKTLFGWCIDLLIVRTWPKRGRVPSLPPTRGRVPSLPWHESHQSTRGIIPPLPWHHTTVPKRGTLPSARWHEAHYRCVLR